MRQRTTKKSKSKSKAKSKRITTTKKEQGRFDFSLEKSRGESLIGSKKKHGLSIYSENLREELSICSNKIPLNLKAKIFNRLDPKSLATLCMTSKKCHENYCQNKRLWDNFAVVKFDTIAPTGVNYFNYYYGREIYEISRLKKQTIILKMGRLNH